MSTQGKLTLRNYRCFNWNNPAILEFGDGFTAFVGPNNSGKSTALRSVYELRIIFQYLFHTLSPQQNFRASAQPLGTSDVAELANDSDPTRFQFSIEIADSARPKGGGILLAIEILLEYEIHSQTLSPKRVRTVDSKGCIRQLEEAEIKTAVGNQAAPLLNYPGISIVDYSDLLAFATELSQSKYFPAFRNAINEGGGNYYDIPVGTALVATWDQWKAGSSRAQKLAIVA